MSPNFQVRTFYCREVRASAWLLDSRMNRQTRSLLMASKAEAGLQEKHFGLGRLNPICLPNLRVRLRLEYPSTMLMPGCCMPLVLAKGSNCQDSVFI